jgi:FkbM family methyltransferase
LTPSTPVTLRIPELPQPLQLHVHGEQDRHVSRRIREEGVWEPYETSLLLSLLRQGDVFVDVGANIGYFSLLAASLVGEQGAVFAFEPDPDNYRLLLANAELNGMEHRITAVEAALSDAAGEGQLYLSADNLGDHQVYAGEGLRNSLPIDLYQGSQYLAERLQRMDLVKVDTQGSEFHVIAGLMPLLEELDPKPRLIIELTPHSLRQAGASGRALIELLATLGQSMWIIDHTKGQLAASSAEELALWCDNWDAVTESRGFMNILVGEEA